MTKTDAQGRHPQETATHAATTDEEVQDQWRAPFEVLSRTLVFQHEDHRLWWERAASKLAT